MKLYEIVRFSISLTLLSSTSINHKFKKKKSALVNTTNDETN